MNHHKEKFCRHLRRQQINTKFTLKRIERMAPKHCDPSFLHSLLKVMESTIAHGNLLNLENSITSLLYIIQYNKMP